MGRPHLLNQLTLALQLYRGTIVQNTQHVLRLRHTGYDYSARDGTTPIFTDGRLHRDRLAYEV
jgi:hypothetical protein